MTNQNSLKKTRGFTSNEDDSRFEALSDLQLIELLSDKTPAARTSSAKILESRKCKEAIRPLCNALKKEKVLYSKIAICSALSAMGEEAAEELIPLLGKIGRNRHEKLPDTGFYKSSYPLPRDIAARTIIRIGPPALKCLKNVLLKGERNSVLEAVDTIGHISFYYKNTSLENDLVELYNKSRNDILLRWKILRAFQGFSSANVFAILKDVILNGDIPALRWEAFRSIALNGCIDDEIIKIIPGDDIELRKLYEKFVILK